MGLTKINISFNRASDMDNNFLKKYKEALLV